MLITLLNASSYTFRGISHVKGTIYEVEETLGKELLTLVNDYSVRYFGTPEEAVKKGITLSEDVISQAHHAVKDVVVSPITITSARPPAVSEANKDSYGLKSVSRTAKDETPEEAPITVTHAEEVEVETTPEAEEVSVDDGTIDTAVAGAVKGSKAKRAGVAV